MEKLIKVLNYYIKKHYGIDEKEIPVSDAATSYVASAGRALFVLSSVQPGSIFKIDAFYSARRSAPFGTQYHKWSKDIYADNIILDKNKAYKEKELAKFDSFIESIKRLS